MSREVFEEVDHIRLSPTQEKLVKSVLEAFQRAKDGQKLLVIVKGMSGVGKSLVLKEIFKRRPGVKVVESDILRFPWKTAQRPIEEFTNNFVTDVTVGIGDDTVLSRVDEDYSEVEVIEQILSGMTEGETREFIKALPIASQSALSSDRVVRYSLGVPLLVQQLCMPGINESEAIQVAATYLRQCHKRLEELQNFLQMEIPATVADAMLAQIEKEQELLQKKGSIYSQRGRILNTKEKLELRTGIRQESPFFVATQSEEIYAEILKSGGVQEITIYVPDLSQEDLEVVRQALGKTPINDPLYTFGIDARNSNRAAMFNIPAFRKLAYWDKDECEVETEYLADAMLDRRVISNIQTTLESALPISPDKDLKPKCLFHCFNHPGRPQELAIIGWMIESLLQRRGISYIVNCRSINKHYIFSPAEPQESQLQVFPGLIEINS